MIRLILSGVALLALFGCCETKESKARCIEHYQEVIVKITPLGDTKRELITICTKWSK